MRRFSAIHWVVIGAVVLCTVLLSFVPTSPDANKRPTPVTSKTGDSQSLEQLLTEARKSFTPELQQKVALVEGAITSERDYVRRGQLFDSLIRMAGQSRQYVFAAWAAEQKAIKNNGSGNDWQTAGTRYQISVNFQQDPNAVPALYEAAIRCFNKAIELEPKNLDAKVGLGICMVEGSNDPMQGIGLLLDVVKEDSTNVNAQLALGDFSIKRNAPDKAIARYSTALRLRPDLYAIHLSLADAYSSAGDTANAILHLEEYVKVTDDPVAKNDIENAIHRLKAGKGN